MARYVLADHLADFNRDRGPDDAPFRCVATDLEMGRGARNTFVYDRWKEFHVNLRDRIAPPASEMQLLTWMQGPDFLLDQMDSSDEREALMMRENISRDDQDATLYHGALRYFVVQDDAPIFDALVPMWYFRTLGPYQRRVKHNLSELHKLDFEALYLIGGFMVRNEQHGLCCPDCVNGRAGYEERLAYNDSVRDGDLSFIGSGVFKWPVPEDWVCGR